MFFIFFFFGLCFLLTCNRYLTSQESLKAAYNAYGTRDQRTHTYIKSHTETYVWSMSIFAYESSYMCYINVLVIITDVVCVLCVVIVFLFLAVFICVELIQRQLSKGHLSFLHSICAEQMQYTSITVNCNAQANLQYLSQSICMIE